MTKTAYYNEFDPKAAAWLRELIKAGLIAPGVVDERSIEDVTPNDLAGFTQCHFFAGIGVWSYALRRAGWSDTRRIWTMSCPCQPFSAAGKGDGFDDERHLWPAGQYLISQCKPDVVFGEQVASKDADTWIDLVHTDMEALGYAFGAIPFPSAGVGAPHIRDRLYWVADSSMLRCECEQDEQSSRILNTLHGASERQHKSSDICASIGGMGQPDSARRIAGREGSKATRYGCAVESAGGACGLGNTRSEGLSEQFGERRTPQSQVGANTGEAVERAGSPDDASGRTGPTNGFWRDADWLGCRDGKWRPVEPGTFPLAHGAAARVGRLRGFGNAINAEAATAFIEAYMNK